jgi:hypothetical protein
MIASPRLFVAGLAAGLACATPARADLVVLSSGRVISAAKVVLTADTATITLRGGGDVTCDRTLIVRVDPDEVPWIDANAAADSASKAGETPAAPRPVEIPAAYKSMITRLAEVHGVDARLIHAVISVESAYRPRARSRKGARGLMQLMPATGRQYGVRNLYQASSNLDAGVRHLKSLLDQFALPEAIAAYNAGAAAVRRFGGIPPFRETRNYVDRVLALAGLEIAPLAPAPVEEPPVPPPAEQPDAPVAASSDRSGS